MEENNEANTPPPISESHTSKHETLKRKIQWPTLIFAIFGLLTALYYFVEFIRIKSSSGLGVGCILKRDTTCGGVVASGYGVFLGIPVGALGLAFWSAVAVIAFLPKVQEISFRFFVHLRMTLAFIGFLFVLWLFYIAEFVGEISCVVCSAAQIVVATFFLYSLFAFMFHRFGSWGEYRRNLRKLAVLITAATVPFLAIGGGFTLYLKFKKTRATKVEQVANLDDAFPREWWAVEPGDADGNGEDYRAGNDKGTINVQLFTDPTCEDCWRAQSAIGQAMTKVNNDNILFVVKFLPLDANCNRYAEGPGLSCQLSVAARCAGRQGRFFEFLNWEYETQLKPIVEQNAYYSIEGLRFQAARFGLNSSEFDACLDSTVELVKIRDDVENANKMGADTAPFIIINGSIFEGDYTDPEAFYAAFTNPTQK